jgi:hypothetical protein
VSEPVVALLRSHYPEVARDLLAPLLKVIDEASHAFRRDLQKFHILLAVALRTAEHPDTPSIDTEELAAGRTEALPSLWTNVHSLALSLGAPEETVRRKVRALVEDGWLERADHSVRYTPKAAREFQRIRTQLLRLTASNYQTVARLIEQSATAPRPGEAGASA